MIPDFSKYDDYVDMSEIEFDAIGEYIPEEVCHYTKMSTALTKILPNKQIILGNLHETNDPLETQVRLQAWINNNPSSRVEPVGLIQTYVSINNIKVLSTCCHNNPSWNNVDLSSVTNNKYGATHSGMWAHYSERHAGVCIVFDGKALDKYIREEVGDNNRVQHGFIKYNYQASIKPLQGKDTKEIWENYRPNFLCKSPEWKTEHEFRWLVRTENENNSKLLVPIENTINAVIVGKNFDQECLPLLQKLCGELGTSPWRIDWINGEPSLFQF